MANASETTSGNGKTTDVEVSEKIECLVGPRRSQAAKAVGVQPMSSSAMRTALSAIERQSGCEILREIRPRHAMRTLSSAGEATSFYKVRMDVDTAVAMAQTAPPSMAVELDSHLSYGAFGGSPVMQAILAQQLNALRGNKGILANQVKLRIVGQDNEPIARANVTLEGEGFPQEGQTDKNGEVTMPLYTAPNGNARSLFVQPHKDYWTRYMRSPALDPGKTNVIRVQSLRETVPGFPAKARHGWGQVLMGLDQLPDEYTGKGAKIAIIDSGADNKHPCLKHITQGQDLTNDGDTSSWATDIVGHGSHCAGVITAQSANEIALRGFAPDAEIHVLKVFPGGQFSSLLDALAYCIEAGIDVVNMSLGSADTSDAVEQQLEEAVQHGVACIVAAGNSGGPVQYPARSRNVLAVAAIGMLNEFPQGTWDAQTVVPSLVGPDGIFSPSFTCHGPEIAVCGPGVAVISTVPDKGFEPECGTSMAAPHITGLAALMVAHHPAFQGQLKERNANRVAGLFSMIRSASTGSQLGNERTGAGIPKLHSMVPVFQAAQAQAAAGTNGHADPSAPQPMAAQPAFMPMSAQVGGTAGNGAMSGQMLGSFQPMHFTGLSPFQAAPGMMAMPAPVYYGMGVPMMGMPMVDPRLFR